MTSEEVKQRVAQGEDSITQFKREPIGVAKLAAELTAFANAEGGVIVFGVSDDGSVIGLDAASKKTLNRELSNAANDNVRPPVYPRTEYHSIDGKQILLVHVPEGVSKPYSDKSGNYWLKSGPDKRRITAPWRVMVFDNRVELISPGCLPNHLDIEKMKAGVSIARNPIIFNFATKELPYRGLGTGVQRAIASGAKMDFVSDPRRDLSVSLPVNLPVGLCLPEHLQRVLGYIAQHPKATYLEMAGFLNRTRETVRIYVKQLKEEYHLLRRIGSDKSGHWEIVADD